MFNQNRLCFYNKKLLFIFKNSCFIFVCPKSSFKLIFIFLKKYKMQNNIFYLNIKKRFFYFLNNSFLMKINSSDLFFIGFTLDVLFIDIFKFLKNIPYFYLFYNSYYFDINSNVLFKNIIPFSFFNLIYFFFYILIYTLNINK